MSDDEARIVSAEQLLAAIPAMLGYMPHEALIVVYGDQEGRMEGAVRVPISVPAEELQDVAEAINTNHPDGACIILMVSAQPSRAIDAMKIFVSHLSIDVRDVIGAPHLGPGAVFMSLITDQKGEIPDWKDSSITAEVVGEGKRIFEDEGQINDLYAPSSEVEPIVELKLIECAELITLMADAVKDPSNIPPNPGWIGSVLVYGPGSRDLAIQMVKLNAANAHTVFADAARHIRGRARVEALTIAGIAAYIDNSGALAAAAFKAAWDTALLMDPPFESELLEAAAGAYHQGMKASQFADAVFNAFEEHKKEGGQIL